MMNISPAILVTRHGCVALSQPPNVLAYIYEEHGKDLHRMVETLLDLDVPTEDAKLLSMMPWQFPANRIAVERQRLGFSPVQPLLHFKPSPPPPDWLTPAMIVKMFQLAIDGPGDPPPGAENDEEGEDDLSERPTRGTLVLPA